MYDRHLPSNQLLLNLSSSYRELGMTCASLKQFLYKSTWFYIWISCNSLWVWLNVGTVWCWHVWGCFPNNFSRVRVCQWSDTGAAGTCLQTTAAAALAQATANYQLSDSHDHLLPISHRETHWQAHAFKLHLDQGQGDASWRWSNALCSIFPGANKYYDAIHWRIHTCLSWEIAFVATINKKFEGMSLRTFILIKYLRVLRSFIHWNELI